MEHSKPRRPGFIERGERATRAATLKILANSRRRDRAAINAEMRQLAATDFLKLQMTENREANLQSLSGRGEELESRIQQSSLSKKEKDAQIQALRKLLHSILKQKPTALPKPTRRTWN